MSESMVERVAKAMDDAVNHFLSQSDVREPDWLERNLSELRHARARAAIEAMREPTKEMLNAETALGTSLNGHLDDTDAQSVWKAMISAALGEPKP